MPSKRTTLIGVLTGSIVLAAGLTSAPAASAAQLYTCYRPSGSAPVLGPGRSNPSGWVKYAQCQLNNAMVDADPSSSAVNLVVDGIWGTKTSNSTYKFQGCVHITRDRLIGSDTWSLLAYWNSRSGFAC